MFTYRDVLYQEERRKDEMVQAEQRRLRRLIAAENSPDFVTVRPWRVRFGAMLTAWGQRLEALDAAASRPTPHAG